MPRRSGWMHDYEMALDQSRPSSKFDDILERIYQLLDRSNSQQSTNAPKIDINVNLGDLIAQAIKRKGTTESVVKELVKSALNKKSKLNEDR